MYLCIQIFFGDTYQAYISIFFTPLKSIEGLYGLQKGLELRPRIEYFLPFLPHFGSSLIPIKVSMYRISSNVTPRA